MAFWRGVIEEYRAYLPVTEKTPVVTLKEGDKIEFFDAES